MFGVDDVVMYVRTTQRRNKDGSVVRYVALAHNRRDGANTKAEVLINLGREDRLDMDGLRRLAGSIFRYLDDEQPRGDQLPFDGGLPDGLDVVSSRPLGTAWLLDGLWRRLGIADAIKSAVGGRRFTTDMERLLFALGDVCRVCRVAGSLKRFLAHGGIDRRTLHTLHTLTEDGLRHLLRWLRRRGHWRCETGLQATPCTACRGRARSRQTLESARDGTVHRRSVGHGASRRDDEPPRRDR